MGTTRRSNDARRTSAAPVTIDRQSPPGPRAKIRVIGAGATDDAPFTRADLERLPAALDVPTAARVLGIGRTMAYDLVRTGQWPTPVVRIGRLVKIPTAPLVALLGAAHTDQHASEPASSA